MREELLKKLLELINRSDNFLSAQLPDVAQQILTYEKMQAFCGIGFGMLLIIASILLFRGKVIREFNEEDQYGIWGLRVAGGIIGAFFILYFVHDLILINVAPKVYLLRMILNHGNL